MEQSSAKIIQINEGMVKAQVGEVVRETVEETLNKMLDAERYCQSLWTGKRNDFTVRLPRHQPALR